MLGLAFAAIVLVLKPHRRSGVWVSAILAFLWAWLAVAYHLSFFIRINPLAYVFSGISLAGALTFLLILDTGADPYYSVPALRSQPQGRRRQAQKEAA